MSKEKYQQLIEETFEQTNNESDFLDRVYRIMINAHDNTEREETGNEQERNDSDGRIM